MKRVVPFAMVFTMSCGADVAVDASSPGALHEAIADTDGVKRLDFDVVAVTPVSADLAWQAHGVTGCTFTISGGGFINVAASDTLRIVNAGVPGPETYTLACRTKGTKSRAISLSRTVLWGLADSVQDLIGVRAVTGSVIAHTDDFITDYANNDLKFVAGAFEIVGDLNSSQPVSVTFAALESIGAGLSIIDNAGFASFSMPALESVGTGVDFTNNVALDTVDLSSLSSMSPTSTFAVQLNPLLSCAEIADVYCGLAVQGVPVVSSNQSPTCPEIVPGC